MINKNKLYLKVKSIFDLNIKSLSICCEESNYFVVKTFIFQKVINYLKKKTVFKA